MDIIKNHFPPVLSWADKLTIAFNFYTAPLKGKKTLQLPEYIELKKKVDLAFNLGMHFYSKNDSVDDGRTRINLLLWNEWKRNKPGDEIIISTHKLDPDLYNKSSLNFLISLITDIKVKVKILYKFNSSNIDYLKQNFNDNSLLEMQEYINTSNEKNISNFIVGSNGISIENDQEYIGDKLVDHKADFVFNQSNIKQDEISSELVIDVAQLEHDFNLSWN